MEWQKAHPERVKERQKVNSKRRWADPEYRAAKLAQQAEYRRELPEERKQAIRDRTKRWRESLTPERRAALAERVAERHRRWKAKRRAAMTPDDVRRESKKRNVVRYGMTIAQWDAVMAEQGGVCAICGEAETAIVFGHPASLGVDHDHKCCPGKRSCGKCLRGLLCAKCNTMLGGARDRRDILEAAIAYLDRGYLS